MRASERFQPIQGPGTLQNKGVSLTVRSNENFTGEFVLVDDSANNATKIKSPGAALYINNFHGGF